MESDSTLNLENSKIKSNFISQPKISLHHKSDYIEEIKHKLKN